MQTKEKKSPYNFKLIWGLLRHGLFLQGLRYGLAKIGIDIMPYYWVQEEYILSNKPEIRGESQDFIFKQLNAEELDYIITEVDSVSETKIHESLELGQACIGLKHGDKIATYMFIELNDFILKNRLFKINSNEAYLLNMYSFDEFRGKNLAPYLRYCCYRYLEEKDITLKYSISNYFNKSAIRFKEKLNSKPLKLFINIELFKTFKWHFLLKTYT
ncbi:hypothetical protein A9Q87_12655 [Flavobacteriales bacterium 34_180_T64]|nr:hypothetical protein A9Q87_12655 [Flavobacteriales bacterium 34_180_T64]